MVAAVNKAGGSAKMTLYPDAAHDAWSDTYQNSEVFRWLLCHQNGNTSSEKDAFSDSKAYG